MQTDATMLHACERPNTAACNAVCHCALDAQIWHEQPRFDELSILLTFISKEVFREAETNMSVLVADVLVANGMVTPDQHP